MTRQPAKVPGATTKEHNGKKGQYPIFEKLSIRQIAAARENRKRGMKEQDIADLMGISLASVSRHTKGVKATVSDGEVTQEKPAVSEALPKNNGGEVPPVEMSKPSMIQIGVELDPELMLMLAGTASVQGFTSLKDYLKEFALPWLRVMKETQTLLSAESPEQYIAKLNGIVKGYVMYQRMLEQAKGEVGKNVVKSDGQQGSGSQKN